MILYDSNSIKSQVIFSSTDNKNMFLKTVLTSGTEHVDWNSTPVQLVANFYLAGVHVADLNNAIKVTKYFFM